MKNVGNLAKKSIIAYLKTLFTEKTIWVIFIACLVLYLRSSGVIAAEIFNISIILTGVIFITVVLFDCITIWRTKLFYDEEGIIAEKMSLPWQKGQCHLRWEDVEKATTYNNLQSWMFRSYKIVITHKYTKNIDIYLTDMYNGHKAVGKINEIIQRRLKLQSL